MTRTFFYSSRLPSDRPVPEASLYFALAGALLIGRLAKRGTEVISFSGAAAWSAYRAAEQGTQALNAAITPGNTVPILETYGPKFIVALVAMTVTGLVAHSMAAATPELLARDKRRYRRARGKLRQSIHLARCTR